MKTDAIAILSASLIVSAAITVNAYGNPYAGGWSNCTWSAWEIAYQNTGIELPGWGNAGNWYSAAAYSGYSVSGYPSPGSIAVWSNHVGYVSDVSDGQMYVIEGGYSGGYHEGWWPIGDRHGQYLIGFVNLWGSWQEPDYTIYENHDYYVEPAAETIQADISGTIEIPDPVDEVKLTADNVETVTVEDAETEERTLTMVTIESVADCEACISVPILNGYQYEEASDKTTIKEESADSPSMLRIDVQVVNSPASN